MVVTPRQREVYDFISSFVDSNGYAPTIAEIKSRFGLRSSATVHQLLEALKREGLIRRIRHAARGIELVGESAAEMGFEVPLLGVVAAGRPIEAILSNEMISVPLEMIGRRRTYALRVRGDSMIEDQIRDGDYIVVESRSTAENGETVVALINRTEATVKRIYWGRDHVRLEPANPNYDPIIVKEPDHLEIQGVVVGLIRKYAS
jgi:repressor LexA